MRESKVKFRCEGGALPLQRGKNIREEGEDLSGEPEEESRGGASIIPPPYTTRNGNTHRCQRLFLSCPPHSPGTKTASLYGVIITECVLHGFKGFAAPFTLRLETGMNLAHGGNESGKSTLCEGILSALFASPSSSTFLNWSHPEVCRVLLFFSTPQARYRVVKDFVTHSADLAIWDTVKSAFLSTAHDPSHVAALLSKELGGVDETVYRTLCVLRAPTPPPTPPVSEFAPPIASSSPPRSSPKREERLQQLKGYLETYHKIQEMELLLDSLRGQYDRARASLQSLVTLEEEHRTVREALGRFHTLESLTTSSLLTQITEYRKAIENRDREASGLQEKIEEEQARLSLIPSTPLLRHRLFLAGGGLFVLSLVASRFLPYVGIGIFIGLGCIAAAVTQYLNWSQKRDKIRKGLLGLEYQAKKGLDLRITRQFQPLLDLLPRTGCHDVSELSSKVRQRDTLREKLTTLEQKIAELSAGGDPAALEEKKKTLEETIQLAEGELRSFGYVPEPLEVHREIEELERGTTSPEGMTSPSGERPSPSVDPLLTALERLLGGLSASLLSTIETQASALVTEMTAGRYIRIRRTPENSLRLVPAGGRGERSLGEVSEGMQDQAFLAWHLALLTAIPPASAVPLLLDNPFLRMDKERRTRLLPFLRSLARTHQVVLLDHEAWIPSTAAHVIPLAAAHNRTPSTTAS